MKGILKKSSLVKKIVHDYRTFVRRYSGLNWWKTIYINFRTQSISDAIKLPLFVYGKVSILQLVKNGIVIDAPLYKGIVKLGYNFDTVGVSKRSAMIRISGKLIFEGPAVVSVDYAFDISGVVRIGKYSLLGNSIKIRCRKSIILGLSARIAYECQIFDTNFHYMKEVLTGRIYPIHKEIYIGDYCWIGGRTTIMKGTNLPDHSTVAGNSLLNKNYKNDNLSYPIFAGMPAKIVNNGFARLLNEQLQYKLNGYFLDNKDADYFQDVEGYQGEIEYLEKDCSIFF